MTPSSRNPPKAAGRTVLAAEQSTASKPICSLPLVGPTTVEDAVFYTAVGAVAVAELVSWPVAALMAGGHALHQRARNVVRTGAYGEAREGVIEAFDEIA
ncbi:MAG: hypothetical protein ACTHQQ_01515 [Solirubrobacteraceae bacterium]